MVELPSVAAREGDGVVHLAELGRADVRETDDRGAGAGRQPRIRREREVIERIVRRRERLVVDHEEIAVGAAIVAGVDRHTGHQLVRDGDF